MKIILNQYYQKNFLWNKQSVFMNHALNGLFVSDFSQVNNLL